MTTRLLRPQITAQINGDEFTVRDAEVTLDAGAVPYASATVELPLLDDTTLAYLDPRENVRVPVSGALAGGVPRVFDLGLREREVDHEAKTVTLTLASDEALLSDYAPLADDDAPFDLAASLRDVVAYVLDTALGATLEAGDDADVTPHWSAVNLLRNPAVVTNLNNWSGGSGVTLAWVSAGSSGEVGVTMTAPTGAVWAVDATKYNIPATPGERYTFSVAQRNVSGGGSGRAALRFLDNNGAFISATEGSLVSLTNNFERVEVTAVAPPSAAKVAPYWAVSGGTGRTYRLDQGLLHTSRFPVPPFTGGDADDAHYLYEFEGPSNDSASVRTPVVERDPESLVWKAGQTAWDFLLTLCASVGMVLWCDEQRRWYLQTPESRTIPDLIAVSGVNSREGTDILTRDDDVTYVTGVVARFKWTDLDGIAQERIDAAGTPEKVLVQEFTDTPFPGPGIAASMLARRAGTGRAQDVTAITQWKTTPGMTAAINLPGAPETNGRVASVTFHADGFMDLGTAGLIDIIPGSWLATDPAEAWTAPPASTWLAWT